MWETAKQWIKDNPKVIVGIVIVFLILGGSFSAMTYGCGYIKGCRAAQADEK